MTSHDTHKFLPPPDDKKTTHETVSMESVSEYAKDNLPSKTHNPTIVQDLTRTYLVEAFHYFPTKTINQC